ncbi:hypothetical protein C8J55DRAFT_431811, partial [Lentinula edodes]
MTAQSSSFVDYTPFLTHLVVLLITQPLPPTASIPLPSYTGPSDWRTDSILRSLSVVVGRMHQAEMQNASSK